MFTVIIVTKDRPVDLAITRQSILAQSVRPDRLIVVDDSHDCPCPKSSGIPAARNEGLKHTEPGVILFLDDDVTLHRDYIKTVSRFMKDNPDVAGVTGWIDTKYHRENILKRLLWVCLGAVAPSLIQASLIIPRVRGEYSLYPVFRKPLAESVPAEWLSGCNMAYRSSVFDEGYRFPEKMKGYALGEDRVFSNRLHRDGKQLRLVYGARLTHRSRP